MARSRCTVLPLRSASRPSIAASTDTMTPGRAAATMREGPISPSNAAMKIRA
ncbi:MAG: hypothetical protein M3332_07680 [Actinomycetota bacterium]|nr:hypothetical protein [Actinomycetota bacterium]